jgi:RHS repeat-associated protein
VSDKKIGVDTNSDGLIDYNTAEVVNANDYYPFGMLMPSRKYSIANTNYRYGFNGKENDNDIENGAQDYGMRIYDGRLGRFLSVDPLSREYAWNSTYAFAENDLIRSVDLDGMEKVIYSFTKANGLWTKTELELPKAGPLGSGVLVKYENGKTKAFYYGSFMKEGSTGKDFTKYYEGLKKDKEGNIISYTIPGEPHTTVGYGHYNSSAEDVKKYPNGTIISKEEANKLFNNDYETRKASTGDGEFEDDALSDYSFTASDKGSKTELRFKKDNDQSNFFVNKLKAVSPKVGIGVARRRSAEQILSTFHKYTEIEYNKNLQKKWESVYTISTTQQSNTTDKLKK